MAGVIFTLADASGPTDSYTTDGTSEPHCFQDLKLGSYQLTIKPPANYGSTTPDAMTVSLSAGVKPNIVYGARRSSGLAPATARAASSSAEGAATGAASGNVLRTILIVASAAVIIALVGVGGALLRARRKLR